MLKTKLAVLAVLATAAGPALAEVATYEIDPMHTYPSISFSHMGLSVWRGKFNDTRGRITVDRATGTGTVNVVIDAGSLDFGLASMHEAARSEKWFNVAEFPKATYTGTFAIAGDGPKTVDGELTLRDVTRPVELTINSFKCMPHPMLEREVCGADAEGVVHWVEFGMPDFGEQFPDKVHLSIQVEALGESASGEGTASE